MTHEKKKHWMVIPITQVPMGVKVLDSVWAWGENGVLAQAKYKNTRHGSMHMVHNKCKL